ncbi:MAG: hypothetical protein WCB01_00025 [Candidatus Cybelea sp.]
MSGASLASPLQPVCGQLDLDEARYVASHDDVSTHDKFGVTWQIVPEGHTDLFGGDDPEKSARVMKAMMGMEKLDINALRAAYRG